jgi:SAM-dependent methyltransferase
MSETSLPNSPVTGKPNVRYSDSILVSDIVRLYRDQEGVDVERFFTGCAEILILECGDTGYRFYYPFGVAGDETFYQELASKRADVGLDYDRDWSEDHEFALNAIEASDRVLEIGCNTGKFLERVKEKSAQVFGLEFNPVAAATAKKRGLDVRNIDIETLAKEALESFDIVCAFQVLEHISEAGYILKACHKIIRPGGKLILSVPNNEPYYQRFSKYEVLNLPPHHVGLWNLKAFARLGEFFDMDLIDHVYSGSTSFRAGVYLRARSLAKVKSPPRQHTTLENALMIVTAPIAVIAGIVDYLRGVENFGHITVTFRKRTT